MTYLKILEKNHHIWRKYTTVAHEKINQDKVQEDIEINEGDVDAPLDDEGQAKDVILDDSELGRELYPGCTEEVERKWHKEKRKLGKNLMIHMASDSGSIQFCTLDVVDEFAMFLYNLDIWKKEKFLQFVSNVDALQQMKEDI
ncbi:hypothetical protein ACJX0J_040675 [Zea mays]